MRANPVHRLKDLAHHIQELCAGANNAQRWILQEPHCVLRTHLAPTRNGMLLSRLDECRGNGQLRWVQSRAARPRKPAAHHQMSGLASIKRTASGPTWRRLACSLRPQLNQELHHPRVVYVANPRLHRPPLRQPAGQDCPVNDIRVALDRVNHDSEIIYRTTLRPQTSLHE